MTAAGAPKSEGASALLPAAAAPTTQDALGLLRADHQRVDAMLADCERLGGNLEASAADRSGLVSRLGALLIAHAQMEQQLFYPILGLDAAQLEQATADHASVETSLQALSNSNADDDGTENFAARIGVLAQQVRAHVKQEESEFFPKAKSAGIDLHELGTQMALRRGTLLGDQGID